MRFLRSRLLLGVGAWLLGATSATVGSLYAVGQLGNSLLAVPSKQLSVAMVNADLAHESSQQAQPLDTALPLNVKRRGALGDADHAAHKKTLATPSQSASPQPSSSAGVLLASPDGSADAVCGSGGAYLLYWSPEPGFEADDVVRGPAPVASVVFRGPVGGIKLRVSCAGGVPVKRIVSRLDE